MVRNLKKIVTVVIFLVYTVSCAKQKMVTPGINFCKPSVEKVLPQRKATTTPADQKPKILTSAEKRKHKRSTKPKEVHTFSTMTYEELRATKDQKVKNNDYELAIKYIEKMIPLCKNMFELKDLTLELADLYFKTWNYEKAAKIYTEFIKLYPGTDNIELASYRAIICTAHDILDAARDQTKTKETLELTKSFLERADVFTKYAAEVRKIQQRCYERLAESEMDRIEFYLKRGNFKAVQQRIAGMRKDLELGNINLEPKLVAWEKDIAQHQQQLDIVAKKEKELLALSKEVKEEPTKVAQATQQKSKSFSDRF